MAIRFRSRAVIWIVGSMPNPSSMVPTEMDDMRTTAVWLSVMLTASTIPLQKAGLVLDHRPVCALRRSQLAGGHEIAGL